MDTEKIEESIAVIETIAPPSVTDLIDDGNITKEDVLTENAPETVLGENTPAEVLGESQGLEGMEQFKAEVAESMLSAQTVLEWLAEKAESLESQIELIKTENEQLKAQLKKIKKNQQYGL